VDPLTHALSGALLARAVSPSADRAASDDAISGESRLFGPRVPLHQALIVGLTAGVFPDVDIVLRLVSDLTYLRGHRGVTHSLLVLPFWSLLIGGLFALLFRRRDAWRRYSWLAVGGIAIHIAGDWITQFGTLLLAPLSNARFGLGSVFIIDLVLTGIIVAGLAVSALLPRSRLPAWTALALLFLWIGVTVVGRNEALAVGRDYAQRQGITAVLVDAAPRPASPFNWTVLVFDGIDYHVAHLNTRRTEPLLAMADDNFIRRYSAPYAPAALARWTRMPMFGDDAVSQLARDAWKQPDFGFFRWFAMFPLIYDVDRGQQTCVWFHDLRFTFPGRERPPFVYGMCHGSGWSAWSLDDAGRRPVRR